MKIIVLTLFIMILSMSLGCETNTDDNRVNQYEAVQEIEYIERKRCGVLWENLGYPLDLHELGFWIEIDSINSKQEAIEFSTAIIDKCKTNGWFADFELFFIMHYTEDNIWRFSYTYPSYSHILSNECLTVAVDGNDGHLIRAWMVY